jgi:hypothetical protein
MTPLWRLARIHGRRGWKLRPFTRLLLVSNLVSIAPPARRLVVPGDGGGEGRRGVGGSGRGGRRERMAMGGEEEGALDLGNGEIWVSAAAVAAEVVRGVEAVGL